MEYNNQNQTDIEENVQRPDRFVIVWGIFLTMVLLLCLPVAVHLVAFKILGLNKANGTALFISRMCYWVILLIVALYSTKVEKQKLLIWVNKKNDIAIYFLSAIIMFIAIALLNGIANYVIAAILHHKEKSNQVLQLIEVFKNNKLLLIFAAFTAGVTEELVFRGYLLPRLAFIFKNSYLAVFVSSLLFAVMHFGYGTIINAIGPFIIGAIFAIHYMKYRNIVFLIVFHFLWDILAFLIAIRMH
ncbi:MAG TPA: type II CAAX endopeptidase family protein [Puia sp.]|nr:type II CAAX endopeptidase family protein [Puia sp.]